jgi:hypothetical protein
MRGIVLRRRMHCELDSKWIFSQLVVSGQRPMCFVVRVWNVRKALGKAYDSVRKPASLCIWHGDETFIRLEIHRQCPSFMTIS